jgi:hypothetical protein
VDDVRPLAEGHALVEDDVCALQFLGRGHLVDAPREV